MIDDEKREEEMTEEEKEFWDKYGDQIPPEIEDEIDGENVLSIEALHEEEDNDNEYDY